MTIKQFVHSTIFKCIIVLLCIALVSGGLLAILNDVWSVSDDEIVNRAIKEICGDSVSLKGTVDFGDNSFVYSEEKTDGKVESAYLLDNGNYLIKATGNGGYHSGTVSVYVLAEFENDSFKEITTVSIADYASSQTLMSKFSDSVLSAFSSATSTDDTNGFVATGASYSSNAVRNAVNSALLFIDRDLSALSIIVVEG